MLNLSENVHHVQLFGQEHFTYGVLHIKGMLVNLNHK